MRKNRYLPLVIFFILFVINVLGDRFLGQGYRAALTPIESLTWNEIYSKLPYYLILSLVLTFVILQILKEAEKAKARDIENARKRIEEKERKRKEQKEKESKSVN
jgi:large-conductance mechanosensitive channel